jgi:hypothetical protein
MNVVTTLTLGSWLSQGHGKVRADSATRESHSHSRECKKVWGNEPTHFQKDSHFGNYSPYKVLNAQRIILKVKVHWIEKLFTPLESSWNLNV